MSAKGKRPSPTPAQRDAILTTGHTLLEAGAGSGKTTTLVEKILHALGAQVVDGACVELPCELSEIVAITFTTAAAADLRSSLRSRLREYATEHPERRWRQLIYEVDRARIGTIHSFCAQLLRECALREGLDPSFSVLDAGEASELREECARARLYEALGADDPDASRLVDEFGPHGATRLIQGAVESGDAAREALARWCDADGRALTSDLRARTEALGGGWRAHDEDGAALAASVLRLAADARTVFDEALDRRGSLDYDALIYRTRDLLRASPATLAGVRRRLAWLFMDEFQDTDPAQRDIAYAICGISEALAARRADAPLPDGCPSLCIVGDPKQSIYGFRRADVTLWSAVARDFAALGATVIPLDTNFRSRSPLLGLVNGTIGKLMPVVGDDAAPDYEVRYRPLAPNRDYTGDDRLVELLALADGENALDRRQDEARRIARRVRAMVDDAEPLVWDGKGERTSARWRDVALLFRSTSDVRLYETELRRLHVPCFVAAGDGFFGTREVRDVRLLLTALADAYDDVAWVGLLRSPWVGLTDDALLRFRVEHPGKPFSFALDVALPGEDGERLAFAAEWMTELRTLRDRVPCAALIERALERSGYAAALLYQQGGDVALANVRKIVRMADGRPDESLAAFAAYLRDRGESSAREAEAALHTRDEDVVVLTTVHGAKGLEWPVVFLCDLDREMAGAMTTPSLFYDAADGVGIRLEDTDAGDDAERFPGAYDCLRSRAALRDLAEEKRVWYVASTRARDRLVLCAKLPVPAAPPSESQKTPKPTPARWLLGNLTVDGNTFEYGDDRMRWHGTVVSELTELAAAESLVPPAFEDVMAQEPQTSVQLQRQIAPVPPVAPLFRRSATELMVFGKDRDEHRRSYLLGLRPSPRTFSGAASDGDGMDARTTGDIVHAIMEMDAVLIERDLDLLLDREISSRLGEHALITLSPAAKERLRRLVERTHSHPAVARLVSSDAVERELPFTWFLSVDGEVSVLHGAMDLVARVDDALEILDFKTHRLHPGQEEETATGYTLQRDLYAAALHEIVGSPSGFSLFFPETSRDVRTVLDAESVTQGRERIAAALREVLRVVLGEAPQDDVDADEADECETSGVGT